MRKETFGKGLSTLLIGAESFFGGCANPQSNYQGNNQQQSRSNDDSAGRAGLTALQLLSGLYGVAGNGTPQQRDAAGFASNLIGEEKRNEAISNSGATIYVSNTQPEQTQGQVYAPQHTTGIENVFIDYDVLDALGNRGIKVGADIKIINKKDIPINFTAYFFWGNGQKMRDIDGKNKTKSGQVAFTSDIFTPPYEQTLFEKRSIFIPINQLDEIQNPGTYNIGVVIAMWDCPYGTQTDELVRSQFVSFPLKK